MKKKKIEAIPFLGLKEDKKQEAVYIATTAYKVIEHERHLFLEVYRASKSLEVPVVRYVATKREWGIYEPETGTWSNRGIKSNDWGLRFCWYQFGDDNEYRKRREINVLHSDEDLKKIKNFFRGIKVWSNEEWWEYFETHEDRVKQNQKSKKFERRTERLNFRIKNTPPLDEQRILEYADKTFFEGKHYLYYKKKGRKATLCCSKCGGVTSGSYRAGDTFGSQFEKYIQEPRERENGICPLCGAMGEYKCQGKSRQVHRMIKYIFLGDKYLENEAVVRYIEVAKRWQLEEIDGENGPEMYAAYEALEGCELARTYFFKNGKSHTDFHKHNGFTGKDFWDDCNLYGLSNISIKAGMIYPDTWENLEGTCLQYSAGKEYAKAAGIINLKEYMESYQSIPQIEMLVKRKLYGVVELLIKGYCGIVHDMKANRLESFLGIRKEKIPLLIEEKGVKSILNILQIERRMNANWTAEQVKKLAKVDVRQDNLELALQFISLQKILNTIEKYAGCELGTNCSTAENRLKHTATTYFDYLRMREQLGYDLQNTVYQKPKNLDVAHNKMVMEINKEKTDARLKEVEEKFPEIKKRYRKLRNRYFYEDEKYLIRPARSAKEIVIEGQILHHCVGGNGYLAGHNRGENIILFLRLKAEPETPYITVEINENRILQWYGQGDKKTDKENTEKWLKAYTTRLKCGQPLTESKEVCLLRA